VGTLEGKGALVTGGSRGIGRAIVKRLAADGATVVFSYLQNEATELLRAANPGETFEDDVARTALRRLGQPEDIAAVVAFLAGPDSGWISGQNLSADGGFLP